MKLLHRQFLNQASDFSPYHIRPFLIINLRIVPLSFTIEISLNHLQQIFPVIIYYRPFFLSFTLNFSSFHTLYSSPFPLSFTLVLSPYPLLQSFPLILYSSPFPLSFTLVLSPYPLLCSSAQLSIPFILDHRPLPLFFTLYSPFHTLYIKPFPLFFTLKTLLKTKPLSNLYYKP